LPFAPAPDARLIRWVSLVWRSRTKMSSTASGSSGARFVDSERNATLRPSAEITGNSEKPFPFAPARPAARLTSVVSFVSRSRT
jgi:hypothetical protein